MYTGVRGHVGTFVWCARGADTASQDKEKAQGPGSTRQELQLGRCRVTVRHGIHNVVRMCLKRMLHVSCSSSQPYHG